MSSFTIAASAILVMASATIAGPPIPGEPSQWVQPIPGTAIELSMLPVRTTNGTTMWVMKNELTWNLFDIFVFRLDEKRGNSSPESDAVGRPTKPYIAVDRGFGHDNFPALSMSFENAQRLAEWVSKKTGRTFRMPTVEEFESICMQAAVDPNAIDDFAWSKANAEEVTHAVGTKKADALGLHDLFGNVAEWCSRTNAEGEVEGVVMGGSFESPSGELGCSNLLERTPMWNDSDPQFPKSKWWLADAAFVGVRLVCVEQTKHDHTHKHEHPKSTNDSKENADG